LLLYAVAAGLTVYLSPTVPATASVRSIYDTLSGAND
jgi:hydroxylamine reductase (hybrid-cluster protein)